MATEHNYHKRYLNQKIIKTFGKHISVKRNGRVSKPTVGQNNFFLGGGGEKLFLGSIFHNSF